MPFVEEQLVDARRMMGDDFWSYGLEVNVATLDAFLDHHHRQGLSKAALRARDLFEPSTWETHKI